MATLNDFDATKFVERTRISSMLAGKYPAKIVATEMKPTKNGKGRYLLVTFEVIEGEYAGRKLWSRLNLENPSKAAVWHAQRELAAICRAVGVLKPADTVELHDIPLILHVGLKWRAEVQDFENIIEGYLKRENTTPIVAPPTQKSADDTPPW